MSEIICVAIAALFVLGIIISGVEQAKKQAERQRNRDEADEYLAKKLRKEKAHEQAEIELADRRRRALIEEPTEPPTVRGAWDDRPPSSAQPTHCPECGALNHVDAVVCSLCGLRLRASGK